MCAEETKDKGKKGGFKGCGCNPGDLRNFLENAGWCCGEKGFADCREIWKSFAEGSRGSIKEKVGE